MSAYTKTLHVYLVVDDYGGISGDCDQGESTDKDLNFHAVVKLKGFWGTEFCCSTCSTGYNKKDSHYVNRKKHILFVDGRDVSLMVIK
jgi:hypothetical protein